MGFLLKKFFVNYCNVLNKIVFGELTGLNHRAAVGTINVLYALYIRVDQTYVNLTKQHKPKKVEILLSHCSIASFLPAR